ncbi:RICIN domain-containing protein [Aliamphritea ceti]|uniref:RICIN domain-containing protein n=1 Tax=Aliamphritea ceti TaxID=1524258 RepID=UPI0021C2FFBE|nr:RICIN domain-containing protein [Aliamphritea ceti]
MKLLKCLSSAVIIMGISLSVPATEGREVAGHLRLIDDLDRPQDGYCLDIAGSGSYVRFDLPMTAHNCKPGLYADEAVVLDANGYIRFPAYGKCVTVAGINSRALPGASVLARDCGERSPFLDAELLQKFELNEEGFVELNNSGLCLTTGRTSDSTYAADHRWRPLFVEECAVVNPAHSRWKFSIPE